MSLAVNTAAEPPGCYGIAEDSTIHTIECMDGTHPVSLRETTRSHRRGCGRGDSSRNSPGGRAEGMRYVELPGPLWGKGAVTRALPQTAPEAVQCSRTPRPYPSPGSKGRTPDARVDTGGRRSALRHRAGGVLLPVAFRHGRSANLDLRRKAERDEAGA